MITKDLRPAKRGKGKILSNHVFILVGYLKFKRHTYFRLSKLLNYINLTFL